MTIGSLERWVLRIADSDLTWVGFNWLRPSKQQRVGIAYVMFSSLLLGLPGILLGAAALYFILGEIDPALWVTMVTLLFLVELGLHLLFAHYWNGRARALAN